MSSKNPGKKDPGKSSRNMKKIKRYGQSTDIIAGISEESSVDPKDWYEKARLLFDVGYNEDNPGRYDEAIQVLEKALEINPTYKDASALMNIFCRLRDLPENRLKRYNNELYLMPEESRIWREKGDALRALKRDDEAIAAYHQALMLDSKNTDACIGLGKLYADIGAPDSAFCAFEDALKTDPNSAEALISKGDLLKRLGRYTDAIDAYDRALLISPDSCQALERKGDVLYNLGRFEDAVSEYKNALKQCHENTTLLRKMGSAYEKLGDYEEEIVIYEKLLDPDSEPDNPVFLLWERRGIAYLRLGELKAAEVCFNLIEMIHKQRQQLRQQCDSCG